MNNVSVVTLNQNQYAIIAPGQITYALDASKEELEMVIQEVKEETKNITLNQTDNFKESIAIMPTFDCNLRCIYCYAEGGKTQEVLPYKTAQKALDYVRKFNKVATTLNMYLVGGGEPLLYFKHVKRIVDYAKKLYKEVIIHVVTNGTFDKDVFTWIIENKVNVRVSYDIIGQNEQRPFKDYTGSKEIVVKNIQKLIDNHAEVMIQCVITQSTVSRMREMVDELLELGVSLVKFEPCLMTEMSRGNESLQPKPEVFANALFDVIEYVADNNYPLLIDTGYFTKPTLGKYCGLGNGNFIVTPEGQITSCVEVGRITDIYADKMMYGKISEKLEINEEKLDFLSTISYKSQKGGCPECCYRLICLGGCPMANIWQNGFPLTKSDYTCTIERLFLPKLLSEMINNDKILNVIMEYPEKL